MAGIMMMDSTLRDGSHAMRHQFTAEDIAAYARGAEKAGIPILVVGHGNGLGASSLQLGKSKLSDREMVLAARKELRKTKLGVFMIPGFGTIRRDLEPIMEHVDAVIVASHCSEADITQKHIRYASQKGKETIGVLMMSHMLSAKELLEQALKMQEYGASGVILMDSAGASLPSEAREKVGTLVGGLRIRVGYHAHNNLGMAVANSLAAIESGATIIDSTSGGLGAGAGNCQLEVLVGVLQKMGVETGLDLYTVIDNNESIVEKIRKRPQVITGTTLVSGMAGVFSGFCPLAERAAKQYGVDARDILMELGRRKIVAGQEDYIIEVAHGLAEKKNG